MHRHHIGYLAIAILFSTAVYLWPAKQFIIALLFPQIYGFWPLIMVVAVAVVTMIGTILPKSGSPPA